MNLNLYRQGPQKIYHPIMIKISEENGLTGTYVRILEIIYDKSITNILLSGKISNYFL